MIDEDLFSPPSPELVAHIKSARDFMTESVETYGDPTEMTDTEVIDAINDNYPGGWGQFERDNNSPNGLQKPRKVEQKGNVFYPDFRHENSYRVCASCNHVLGDSEIKMSKELLPDYSCHKCAHKVAILGLPKAPKSPVGWTMLIAKVGNSLRKGECPACQTDVFGKRALDAIGKLGCPICGNTGTAEGVATTFGQILGNLNEFVKVAQEKINELLDGAGEQSEQIAPDVSENAPENQGFGESASLEDLLGV